jgi:ketosteroid isomerase-like protein
MSQENVEIVRRAFAHFTATGEPAWDITAQNVVVCDHDIMDGEEYRGHAGVDRWLSEWATAWSDFSFEPEEFLDADRSVVVVARLRARGAQSGAEVERQDAMVFELRDGKTVRIDYYNSRDQALQAVGLAR